MVKNIKAALEKRIDALRWMAPAPKAEAKKKVATMAVGIGYPDKWRDYGSLDIRADDAFGNLDRAELANYQHQLSKIGQPVDKNEWWMTPQTVNAVNLPLQNALNFPAAILDKGFYDPAADAGRQLRRDRLGHRARDQPQLRQSRRDVRRHRQAAQLVDAGGPRALQAGGGGARRAVQRL